MRWSTRQTPIYHRTEQLQKIFSFGWLIYIIQRQTACLGAQTIRSRRADLRQKAPRAHCPRGLDLYTQGSTAYSRPLRVSALMRLNRPVSNSTHGGVRSEASDSLRNGETALRAICGSEGRKCASGILETHSNPQRHFSCGTCTASWCRP